MSSGIPTASISGNMIVYPNNGAGGRLGIGVTNPSYNIDTAVVNGQRGLNVTGTGTNASDSFYGQYNTLSFNKAAATPGIIAGVRNDLALTNANTTNAAAIYGVYNSITNTLTNPVTYGLYNTYAGSGGNNTSYGAYTDFSNLTASNSTGYAYYTLSSPASSTIATRVGLYNKMDNTSAPVGVHNVFTADQTSINGKGIINDFTNTAAVNGNGLS